MTLGTESSYKKNGVPPRSYRMEIVALCVVISISAMYYYCLLRFAAIAPVLYVRAATSATPQSLNITDTSLIPNGQGPVLYYNGSGPVPPYNEVSPDPVAITPITSPSLLESAFYTELFSIANGTSFARDNCTQCVAGAEVLHLAAITLPVQSFTNILIRICDSVAAVQKSIYAVSCTAEYSSTQNTSIPYSSGGAGLGAYYAQLFSKMSLATGDMTTYCFHKWDVCQRPQPVGIDESLYFSTKPSNASSAPSPSGSSLNVLHFSDSHLDPRYDVGSEANCSEYLCCRPYATNTYLGTTAANASVPASRFGYLYCDSPPDLLLSSFEGMHQFFKMSDLSFSIFTGDIVSHDKHDQLSRAYVEYEERVTYETFKTQLGNVPLYPTLGNHDSLPEAFNAQNSLNPSGGSNAMGWNYELLSSMWETNSWITGSEQHYASTHYGAYAHTTASGLRIISINADFWYTGNPFVYWNVTNPDNSGILAWLSQELSACESRGQRAWIIAHVLSGYDGTNNLANPTALFYSIVVRYSPSTIAGIFFGHTHEDQMQIFYDYLPNSTYVYNGKTCRDTTMVDYSKPLMVAYIGPSITPLTGNNAGYRLYQVDAATFEVTGVQTYFANVSESLTWSAPVWTLEYDTRETYSLAGGNGKSWPSTAPLNATFWHGVTESMLKNQTLVELYNLYETKSSVMTKNCTSKACAQQKVCYIRSGSGTLGRNCGSGKGPF